MFSVHKDLPLGADVSFKKNIIVARYNVPLAIPCRSMQIDFPDTRDPLDRR
jgi:hypothetical protein